MAEIIPIKTRTPFAGPHFVVKPGSRIVYKKPSDAENPYHGFEVQEGQTVEIMGVRFSTTFKDEV